MRLVQSVPITLPVESSTAWGHDSEGSGDMLQGQRGRFRGSGDMLNVKLYDCTFADDVNTIVVGSTNQQVLKYMKTVKEEFGEYFSASGLKESAGKACHILFTKGMDSDLHIGLRPDEVDELYKLNGVKAETEIKLLGLTISERGKWDTHISKVIGKMVDRLPHLRSVRYKLPKEIMLRISNSLVTSLYAYGCEITSWVPSNQRRVQRIFNMLLRILTYSDRKRSISSMLEETGYLNANLLYRFYTICSIQRMINTESAFYTYQLVNLPVNKVKITRYKMLAVNWRTKKAAGWHSFLMRASRELNALQLYMSEWQREENPNEYLQTLLKEKYKNANL